MNKYIFWFFKFSYLTISEFKYDLESLNFTPDYLVYNASDWKLVRVVLISKHDRLSIILSLFVFSRQLDCSKIILIAYKLFKLDGEVIESHVFRKNLSLVF